MQCARRQLTVLVLVLTSLMVVAHRQADAGGLSLVEIQRDGVNGVDGLRIARQVAISPDGAHVYVAGDGDNAVALFSRNPTTGALTFVGMEQQNVNGVVGLLKPRAVLVTPDGLDVYVTAFLSDSIVAFSRNPVTGDLTFVEAQLDQDAPGTIPGLADPIALAISPDGEYLYVAGNKQGSVVVFDRNPTTGQLTYVETEFDGVAGVSGLRGPETLAVSPDGLHLYVLAGSNAVLFTRNVATGQIAYLETVTDGAGGFDGLSRAMSILFLPGAMQLYTASRGDNAIALFDRNTLTGSLTFNSFSAVDGENADGLKSVRDLALSPDATYLYAAANDDKSVAVFKRNPMTGILKFLEAHKDGKAGIDGLDDVADMVLSPDGANIYTTSFTESAVTVFTVDTCGNGKIGTDEQCDDGNVVNSDGCSATCMLELCGAAPIGGCRVPESQKGQLNIKNSALDKRDQVVFQWKKGAITPLADYGNPVTTANYIVCIYDSSVAAQPLLGLAAPHGGTCAGKACWQASKPTVFKYRDPLLTPNGVQAMQLTEGLEDGKASISMKAKGVNVGLPALPLTTPVTVQVGNTQTGVCWQAVFSTATANSTEKFKAKSD